MFLHTVTCKEMPHLSHIWTPKTKTRLSLQQHIQESDILKARKPYFLFSCHVQSQTAGASWKQLQALSCSRLFTCMWLWWTQLCLRGKNIYNLQQIFPLNAHALYFSPFFFFLSLSLTIGVFQKELSGHVIVLNNERGDQSSTVSCCADIYVGAAGQQFITAQEDK